MIKKACNTIDTFKKQFLIATILLAGLFMLPKIMIAQDTAATPYWQIVIKNNCYQISPNKPIDTITISKRQQKASICIVYKNEDTSADLASKKTIILMTATRQEIGRYELVNNTVNIPLATIIATKTAEQLISINVVQQPSNSSIVKRARLGTKLICYLKW